MNQCTEYQPLVKKIAGRRVGTPREGGFVGLRPHCKDCRELITLNASLTGCELVVPGELHFNHLRRSVLRALPPRESSPRPGMWARLTSAPALGLAIAASLFVAGFASRATSWQSAKESVLLAQIRREARENKHLADVEASPYTYSKISFRRYKKGTVALSFDVTRRVDLDPREGRSTGQGDTDSGFAEPVFGGHPSQGDLLRPKPDTTPSWKKPCSFRC